VQFSPLKPHNKGFCRNSASSPAKVASGLCIALVQAVRTSVTDIAGFDVVVLKFDKILINFENHLYRLNLVKKANRRR